MVNGHIVKIGRERHRGGKQRNLKNVCEKNVKRKKKMNKEYSVKKNISARMKSNERKRKEEKIILEISQFCIANSSHECVHSSNHRHAFDFRTVMLIVNKSLRMYF